MSKTPGTLGSEDVRLDGKEPPLPAKWRPSVCAPPHPTPKLVELGETETVRVFDDHDRGVGNIHPDFDDRGRDQSVDFAPSKAIHDRFTLITLQATVHGGATLALEVAIFQPGEMGTDILEAAFGFINDRHDDICLLARIETRTDITIHII